MSENEQNVETEETNETATGLSPLALRAFAALPLAYAATAEWATTDEVQAALNGQDGAEFAAVQVVEAALAELYHVGRVEMVGGETKKWRDHNDVIVARLARLLQVLTDGDVSMDESAAACFDRPVDEPRFSADLEILKNAGIAFQSEDKTIGLAWHGGIINDNDVEDDVYAVLWSVAERALADHRRGNVAETQSTEAQEQIKEVASWREKHAGAVRRGDDERKRADDLARWLRQHGIAEHDALDEVRGVVRKAASQHEEFEWTSSRIVDSAEKGVIFGEVLELENEIAAVRLAAEETAGEHKSKIKGIEAKIKDLKNAAACNQRVVSVQAYKRTNWETKRVIIHAVDDHRVLAEEDLPAGTQRPIPGTEGANADAPTGEGSNTPAIEAAVDKFVDSMQALADKNGATISIGVPGKEPVVVAKPSVPEDPADAPLDTSEPGPLASDEQRAEHAKKPKRKAKGAEVQA